VCELLKGGLRGGNHLSGVALLSGFTRSLATFATTTGEKIRVGDEWYNPVLKDLRIPLLFIQVIEPN
jgi:hypothetical protein